MGFPQNERLTQGTVLLSAVLTASPSTNTITGPAIDLSKVRKVANFFTAGALASSEVITCTLQGCATANGSYTAIAGASVTLSKSATDDNKTQVLEISAESVNNLGLGYRFIQTTFTCGVGSPVSVCSIGAAGPEEPIGSSGIATATIKAITVI